MSFWFTKKDRNGTRHVYSVNAPPQIVVPIVAILFVMIVGLLRGCLP